MYTTIVGYARTKMDTAAFREKLRKALPKDARCVDCFLKICYYHSGQYDSNEDFSKLSAELDEHENTQCQLYTEGGVQKWVCNKNRLFYFAIPPSQFPPVSKCIHGTPNISALTQRHLHQQQRIPPPGCGEALRSRLRHEQGAEQLHQGAFLRRRYLRGHELEMSRIAN